MNRRYIFFVVLMIAVVFISPLNVSADDDDDDDETYGFEHSCSFEAINAQALEKARGHGLMCTTRHGVRAGLYLKNLVPGDAYTVWWIYFDDPTLCGDQECEDVGFGGENPLAVFGRMDSSIAPQNGKLRFSGRIGGFEPSSGAQIWLWLFGHGPADIFDGRHLARQLLTPELPGAGAPHLGNEIDGLLGFAAAVAKFDIP